MAQVHYVSNVARGGHGVGMDGIVSREWSAVPQFEEFSSGCADGDVSDVAHR